MANKHVGQINAVVLPNSMLAPKIIWPGGIYFSGKRTWLITGWLGGAAIELLPHSARDPDSILTMGAVCTESVRCPCDLREFSLTSLVPSHTPKTYRFVD